MTEQRHSGFAEQSDFHFRKRPTGGTKHVQGNEDQRGCVRPQSEVGYANESRAQSVDAVGKRIQAGNLDGDKLEPGLPDSSSASYKCPWFFRVEGWSGRVESWASKGSL